MCDNKGCYKVKLASLDKSMDKHDVVKLLLVRKLLQKHKRRNWIRIYTEFELENDLKPDVYFENIKDKTVIVFEIQKEYTNLWLKAKETLYLKYRIPFFNSLNFIPINLNNFSDNINEINKELEKYVI